MTIPLHCYYFALGSSQELEYGNARDALRKHVDREDKGVAICDTLGGRQQTTVLIQHSGSNYKTQAVIITAEGRHY